MKIIMIGESANHAAKLVSRLDKGMAFLELPRDAASSDQYDADIAEDDVVITLRFSRPVGQAPKFKLLHVPGAGLDGIDMEALQPCTTVCNVFEHEIAIAEYVLLSMLDHEIGLTDMRRRFSDEPWGDVYRSRIPHGELYGKTLGLIGMGRISKAIAGRVQALGMRVVSSDVTGAAIPGLFDEFVSTDRLDDLLVQSDYVVVACPLTASTRGMIGKQRLSKMKPTAVILNISRAEIIDEAALFSALQENVIGGAVLDVWYRYPASDQEQVAPAHYPFHTLPNTVCTPHSSAWTTNLPNRRYAFIARNIQRLMGGEPLQNVVKPAHKV